MKAEWRAESLGWFDAPGELVGAGAGALPPAAEGGAATSPTCPRGRSSTGTADDLAAWLDPLAAAPAAAGRLRHPDRARRWSPAAGAPPRSRTGIADPARPLARPTCPPTEREPAGAARASPSCASWAGGRRRPTGGSPPASRSSSSRSRWPRTPRTEDDVLAGMNQLWRRNIKKAGQVRRRGHARHAADDLAASTRSTSHTAERDHFTPAPAVATSRPCRALGAEDPDRIRLYLARHEGDLVAATIWIRVGAPRLVLLRRLLRPTSATCAAPTPSSGG